MPPSRTSSLYRFVIALGLIAFLTALSVAASAGGLPTASPKGLSGSAWSSIRAEYQRHRQAVFPEAGCYRARNDGQRWVTRFDGIGFDVTPDAGGWSWGLELNSYGFPGQEHSVKHAVAKSNVEKLAYQWDSLMTEWFVNDDRGLEQGFTLAGRPGKSGLGLTLHLSLRGTLTPLVSPDGRRVSFLDAHGAPALNYAGLKVTDAQSRELNARFTREPRGLRLEVEEQNATYPITIDPIAQQAYLKPATVGNSQAGDWFGYSVAVSGDTVVVGAPQEDSSSLGVNSTPNELAAGSAGAAYVFIQSGGVWSQQAYLKPAAAGPGGQAGDHFGHSVAISGDTIVVGAPDEDSSTTGVNSTPLEGASDSGAVYVFVRNGGTWSQQAYLKPPVVGITQAGAGYEFGWSVAISGDTIAVGAYDEASSTTGINTSPNELAPGAGAAYVFARSGTVWSQQAYLKPAAVGTTQANDHFGNAIAVSGDTVVVGAFQEDSSSTGINSTPNELSGGAAGAAYVYFRSGGVWSQQAYLKPAAVGTTQAGDVFGTSVAISGDTVAVGASQESSSTLGVNTTPNEAAGSSGAVYVFIRSVGVWSQQAYVKPSAVGTTQAGDGFGTSVALSGDTMVVGAIGEDSSTIGIDSVPNESSALSGAAYVFTRNNGVWSQQAYLKPAAVGSTQAGDAFGWSVAVSGGMAVVGAYLEDSSTLGVNGTPNEASIDSGTAYVFTVPASATAFITSPVSGSTLSGPNVTFFWTAGTGAISYFLVVGTLAGDVNLFFQDEGLGTLQAVNGLPTDGSTIHVRLYTNSGAGLLFNDYTYTSSTSGACNPSLSPGGALWPAAGGSSTITMLSGGGCAWGASTTVPFWVIITAGNSGNGNGTVGYTVAANPSNSPRSGSIIVNGLTFIITQSGANALLRFVPVQPCRIADTRSAVGPFGGPSLGTNSSRDFAVPASACGIPANAAAYSLNMTVVPLGGLGFLQVWPTGQPQPGVSTLNSSDGRIKANAAIVPAGVNGSITVFASNPTNVIIDINGYFIADPGGQALAFYPISPCRIADTRSATGTFGGPALVANTPRDFPVLSSICGIPASAKAYALNMTVVPSVPVGFLSTWPAGTAQPGVSTLNDPTGTIVANAAIVPAGVNGAISVFATQTTNVIVDINGYFAPPGQPGALSFYPLNPCRIIDTRSANGTFGGPILAAGNSRDIPIVSSGCGAPATAKAYSLNATVVPPAGLGFLQLWNTGGAQPGVSTLNDSDATIVANAAIIPAGTGGSVTTYASNATHLILDINGYFAP